MPRQTQVAIDGERFLINGRPTYEGRTFCDYRIEGLLLNSRMVQGVFDDLNPETRSRWVYPDTGVWDPRRNTDEFVAAMPGWRAHGLLAFTLNLQGGSPEGYSRVQPWHNSAFTADGELRNDYLARAQQILDRADALGMVVILGLFYQGQDERLADEAAVGRAVDNAVGWLLDRGYTNVLVEINNECNTRYEHEILQPHRVHELIARAKSATTNGRRLLVSTSYGGRGRIPDENVVAEADFLLVHGNGVSDPDVIADMVERTRAIPNYRPVPILFNEDDHYDFDQPWNNFVAALSRYASWGYFDPAEGAGGAGARGNYVDGFQNVPVNWTINTDRKRAFFDLLSEVTGEKPS